MNGFDDIISNLDGWIEKRKVPELAPLADQPQPDPQKPGPPRFNIGTLVRIRETRWPPESGRVLVRTGLYAEPGYPKLKDLELPSAEVQWEFNPQLHKRLQEKLMGTVHIGDVCEVIAVHFCDEDKRWYYFINNRQRSDGKGWTRCDFRFEPTHR